MRHPLDSIHASICCGVAACLYALSAPAQDCDPVESYKLLDDDGLVAHHFAYAVAMTDTWTLVGSEWDDDHGDNAGAVYVFDTQTGAPLTKLYPDIPHVQDLFGYSVAVDGSTAVVGAPLDDEVVNDSGAAYVFDLATGLQLVKLLPADGHQDDYFGSAVAISGTTVVIGSRLDDDNGRDSGSAYVFDITTGQQIAKLVPEDGASQDFFGHAVAVNGSVAAVGAHLNDERGTDAGAVYLFDAATGVQRAKLLADDGVTLDRFGYSLALCDETLLIGAPDEGDNGVNAGAAYVFNVSTGIQSGKLLAPDGEWYEYFGWSTALQGDHALIGAYRDNAQGTASGSAYLFDISTGELISKLLASDGAVGDKFGYDVGISKSTAVIAAIADDDQATDSGSAYLFDLNCPAVPTLAIQGVCPGPMQFVVTDASPGGRVAYVYAYGSGSVSIPPGNPCIGTVLGLNGTATLSGSEFADVDGTAVFEADVPAKGCGRVYMQAIDLTSCTTTNVVLIQ
ncbi:MAG: hypothetical protein D8M59_10300 [Planctomycetes bacterium]|nr:hypothetical protein [Planctomycetota bacterium]NOG55234.1 hypothetical protein [Planctomycetota bacterium]